MFLIKTCMHRCSLTLVVGLGLAALRTGAQVPDDTGNPEAAVYQVEIVVFRHVGAPLLPPATPKNYAQNRVPLLDLEVVHDTDDSAGKPPASGAPLEAIADRLNQSGDYAVLLQQSWLQRPGVWPNPPVKWLHDDIPLTFPNDMPLAEAVDYQLEGTAGFAVQRYYHLVLDFEWRARDETGRPVAVDRLAQSRQIEPGRVEYFDTAGLAVLARVTRLETADEPPRS